MRAACRELRPLGCMPAHQPCTGRPSPHPHPYPQHQPTPPHAPRPLLHATSKGTSRGLAASRHSCRLCTVTGRGCSSREVPSRASRYSFWPPT